VKRFKVLGHVEDLHPDDTQTIVRVIRAKGYECSPEQARELWQQYSRSFAAGWLVLPEDDEELFTIVNAYMVDE
jgi:hypothetical protein